MPGILINPPRRGAPGIRMYKPRTGKSAGDISTLPVFTADFANILLALKLIIRCADVARA